ncbi:MAG: hypothetical protein DRR08_25410 [Candidatus Parabeggiatoa sp. nov. 2]|nr:MAG: hypothetical protein B6247_21075 [Beggiatoa sp. 4572_84]RKZ55021.1 MAG: hypothetical protein DRR08_25410 [Gammaproteobacteria bacterium]HEC84245.1 hypothetical protein [Thioploca sp.]
MNGSNSQKNDESPVFQFYATIALIAQIENKQWFISHRLLRNIFITPLNQIISSLIKKIERLMSTEH